MTNSKTTILGLLFLLTCVLPGYSATFIDNFDNGVLNPNVWATEIYGVTGEVVERNQRLEFIVPQDSIPAPINSLTASLSCRSLFQLRGDFDVQVDYVLFNGSHFDNGGIGLTTSDGGVWRYNSPAGSDVYGFVSEAQTTNTAGTLRLVRVGSAAIAYYLSAGNWVSLGSSPYATNDVNIVLAYHNYADSQIGSPVYLALDNFTVNEGQIVPVPEPSAFAVLACGLAGILSRTRKRQSS